MRRRRFIRVPILVLLTICLSLSAISVQADPAETVNQPATARPFDRSELGSMATRENSELACIIAGSDDNMGIVLVVGLALSLLILGAMYKSNKDVMETGN